MSVVISFIIHILLYQLLQAAGGLTRSLILQTTLSGGNCSCELGICIWDEISQMRKTCLPPVSVLVQGLACPGGGNKLLLLLYHHHLMVNFAYCLTWRGDDCVLKAWLPAVGRKGVLVLCCLTLYCENVTGTSSSEAAHFGSHFPPTSLFFR